MIKVALHSDMHLELQSPPNTWLAEYVDVVVLAGDQWKISDAGKELIKLSNNHPSTDFIYVPGNHEFYGTGPIALEENQLREKLANVPNVHFLQCEEATIRGIRFLGCTGWSRMTALGEMYQSDVMSSVKNGINDFQLITNDHGERFTVHDCEVLGRLHYEWLKDALSVESELPTIVVTHFSPSLQFSNPKYPVSAISAYFCNDYEDLIYKYRPKFWLYGHTHFNYDECLENTRIISNQHGYGDECGHDYNANFSFTVGG